MPREASDPTRERDALGDMLGAAQRALRYVEGMTRDQFDGDEQCQDAITRCLEIVGEAAGRLRQAVGDRFPEIPWAEMIAMRNRLIHGYDTVELDIVWDTVHNDLATLVDHVSAILQGKEFDV